MYQAPRRHELSRSFYSTGSSLAQSNDAVGDKILTGRQGKPWVSDSGLGEASCWWLRYCFVALSSRRARARDARALEEETRRGSPAPRDPGGDAAKNDGLCRTIVCVQAAASSFDRDPEHTQHKRMPDSDACFASVHFFNMRPVTAVILALCSTSTALADTAQVRQVGKRQLGLGGVLTTLLGGGGATTTSSSTRPTSSSSRPSSTLVTVPSTTAGVSAAVSASLPGVSVGISASLSIPTTNLVSATVGLSAAPLFTSNAVVSASVAVCVPAATPLFNVPALATSLSSITDSLNKAANPMVPSNPLLGILSPLIPSALDATATTTNTLVSVNALGILAGVSAGGGCLSVDAELNICQLLEQLLFTAEVLLTRIQNTCANTKSLGPLCNSLSIGLVLQRTVALQTTIDQLTGALISLGILPSCSQRMATRRAELKQTLAGTIITLNNVPNVVTTNIGNQLVGALGFTNVNDPLFQSLAGYPNKKRRGLSSRRGRIARRNES
ncbi:hypothetical protein Micbo1qcDRAFT_179981 [Microdochium bolleyi]|uniref:Uncharacterized protein n=1 Tax=Microdochium bolleyi TaxID=196109 RepID=A0A136IND6_9PEZI|nr:hypothetical protein Micbo1qcDRAFT_179981 [Microdochium bolleyi]